MKISKERLIAEAEATGFRAEVLEKVIHLLSLLNAFRSHPFLKGRLVLKGGTALNLFIFNLPRLSVDIDLNYIGAVERDAMIAERPKIEYAIKAVCSREGLSVRRVPAEHAGGKWMLRYESALGLGGNLQVDLNFMFRIPLWPVTTLKSHPVGSYEVKGIEVLDIHELAAGKLVALLSRHQARDLFDAYQLLSRNDLDCQRLRQTFLVYGAMNRKDWRIVSPQDVDFEIGKLEHQLLPLLRRTSAEENEPQIFYGKRMVKECQHALSTVLPFSDSETEFLNQLLDKGNVVPSLMTSDENLQDRIRRHPLIEWKALNVRKYKD
jgi:predicted nucleotidyltransferase component of viral defense system